MHSNPRKRKKENTPFKLTDHIDAEQRYEKYKSEDPFPDIPAALLNSADIYDYAATTGMICPFDSEGLKSASYEMKLQGDIKFWNENGEEQLKPIHNENDKFHLKPNSIAFVYLEPIFRLPDYIALRFNLKIKHVHRGLLLGTGPLIDPGYKGQLLIPLHNLTTNEYTFTGGEGLIWIEFTKLSPNPRWLRWNIGWSFNQRSGKYEPFELRKQEQSIHSFLSQAAGQRSIQSSIPFVIQNAEKSAREAEKSAREAEQDAKDAVNQIEKSQRQLTIGGVVAGTTLVLGLMALSFQVFSMVGEATNLAKETRKELDALQNREVSLPDQRRNKPVMDAIKRNDSIVRKVQKDSETVSKRVDDLVLYILIGTAFIGAIAIGYLVITFKDIKSRLKLLREEIKDLRK